MHQLGAGGPGHRNGDASIGLHLNLPYLVALLSAARTVVARLVESCNLRGIPRPDVMIGKVTSPLNEAG
jgi:hypothetical protein